MTEATAAVSPLRRRMIDDMSLRNLSPATQRSYIHAVKRFARFHRRSPDQLGLEDVRAFQVYLVSQGISWPALNQTVCALRFFYGVTLDRAEIPERIAYARTPRKLPDILSADEPARPHQIHRNTPMGTWVLITAIWYYMQTNIAEIRRVGQQPAL